MALGLPGCGRERREMSAEIYPLLNLFVSNFLALSLSHPVTLQQKNGQQQTSRKNNIDGAVKQET